MFFHYGMCDNNTKCTYENEIIVLCNQQLLSVGHYVAIATPTGRVL